ncbi:hypothetical protein BGX29_005870 [Mortierella sp. GBA35]|nr:hypothetical protein BGX29_005870 [Mortierella sp. GBA35]
MKYRFCYPLLVPIRILIALLTASNIISIFVGKRLSQDSLPPSTTLDPTTVPATLYASEDQFQDSEQAGINIALLAGTLYMLYRPRTRFWWLTSNLRLTILTWTFAILGIVYAVTQYVKIVSQRTGRSGCENVYFEYTRMRCRLQYGVCGSQVGWAVLLVLESFVMVQQKGDRKWNEQRADEEIQGAVMYRPDIFSPPQQPAGVATRGIDGDGGRDDERRSSLDGSEELAAAGIGIRTGTAQGFEAIELSHRGSGGGEREEDLPEYTIRKPRNQPLIVDTAHPPQRLAGAVTRRIQSESTTNTASTLPPLSTALASEPDAQGAAAQRAEQPSAPVPPPPSYTP